ncbi:MAG TPA: hypothetical protein VI455_09550 [Terriglobia bacterium]
MIAMLPAVLLTAAGKQGDKAPTTYTIPLPPRPDFSALEWIMGDWAGHTVDARTGKETDGTVQLTLSYALDKRFVRISEDITLPAGNLAPAVHESWTGFLNAGTSGSGFTLRAFSSTGFITEYHVSVTDAQIRFDPEGGANPPPGWLFRHVISRLGPRYFSETVEVAPPGGSFFPYYNCKLTEVLKPKSPPAAAAPSSPPASPSPTP